MKTIYIRRYLLLVAGVLIGLAALACSSAATSPTATPRPPVASALSRPSPTSSPAQAQPTANPRQATTGSSGQEASSGGKFTWQIEQVDTGSKPSLALDSEGTPYVAYMLESMSGFVKNAIRKGDAWDISTIAKGYFYGPLDIAIGVDDIAHVTYHDHQDSTFKPNKGDPVVASLIDGKWDLQTITFPGHDGWDVRIAVAPDGTVDVSGIDPVDFGGDGVRFYHRDASGKWTEETVGSGPLTYKYATSVAVDPQGAPHITYHAQPRQGNGDLALASKSASGWEIETVDSDGDTGLFSYLVIDKTGRYHISYFERKSGSSGVVKYATRAPGNSAWEISEVGALDKLVFGFVGARNITSLALDSKGNPWIAYTDQKTLKLAVWDGATWQTDTVADAGSKTFGQIVTLKVDGNDEPHLTYFEQTSSQPLNGRVMYAKGTRN